MRFAVSVVTCRQAATLMPARGWVLMNCLRIVCSTGIDWNAHSVRRLPRSARARSFTSHATCVCVSADIFPLLTGGGFGDHGGIPEGAGLVGLLPREALFVAAEVTERGRIPVDGPPQLQMIDNLPRLEREMRADEFDNLRLRH